ncbi:tetraspanin-13 isoform X1 [Frankliniella occidentalis]|uniref:Tetraspanin-13 isoform X1 n=1 Tax=Frankliniella occidentalis TaxID=133901 RepID=A0A6J1SCR9_FRAOC|nr:tetraspanin-13 isoform X1 [Frankliniella occidentalis]XP_052126406.1 tetraspanin-13 isoform X1 [Frankliniella occidentalis]
MCGGFTCSKRALVALNILYIVVAFVLIGVAIYGRNCTRVIDLPIIGGIMACGIFLILISILGLIGAVKHHQVVLFFYMVILFMLFLVQFSVACACLAVNKEQQRQLAKKGWERVSESMKEEVEKMFSCCDFEKSANSSVVPSKNCTQSNMPPCIDKLQTTIDHAFKLCGGIGLFFSFTEVIAAWVACRYRNQFDPTKRLLFPRSRIY